jgi:hypothetical protein
MTDIRAEFERAFVDNRHEWFSSNKAQGKNFKAALFGAAWMAERCAEKTDKDAYGQDTKCACGFKIRQLATQLENKEE